MCMGARGSVRVCTYVHLSVVFCVLFTGIPSQSTAHEESSGGEGLLERLYHKLDHLMNGDANNNEHETSGAATSAEKRFASV